MGQRTLNASERYRRYITGTVDDLLRGFGEKKPHGTASEEQLLRRMGKILDGIDLYPQCRQLYAMLFRTAIDLDPYAAGLTTQQAQGRYDLSHNNAEARSYDLLLDPYVEGENPFVQFPMQMGACGEYTMTFTHRFGKIQLEVTRSEGLRSRAYFVESDQYGAATRCRVEESRRFRAAKQRIADEQFSNSDRN